MDLVTTILAKGFESVYHALNKKKTCRLCLEPDSFEDTVYTIDAFYEYAAPYFDRPCDFFECFRSLTEVNIRAGRHPKAPVPAGVDYEEMIFDSPVTTPWLENNTVPFKWFAGREADTALLFAPGWGRSSQSFEEEMCRRLRAQGVDAVLLTKPFHQSRTPSGSFTGEYFISSNVFLTIQNFRQFVAEIRLVTQFLRQHYKRVGIIGMSSGGFQAGLAANCESFDFMFPFVTGCSLADITWYGLITQYVRRDLERRGVTREALKRAWSITDLAVVGRHCRARFLKHYIALHDRVIPTKYQLELWRVYNEPARKLLNASHYSSYFLRHAIVDDIIETIDSVR